MPKAPHILLASSNCRRLRHNLSQILDDSAIAAIDAEINRNVGGLFGLGREHLSFAKAVSKGAWRQRVSRLYYAAYNVSRSVRLANDGHYSTESSEHKRVDLIPSEFPNVSTYTNRLGVLRDDRNLADYDHTASIADLILTPEEAELLVDDLVKDATSYLSELGIPL